MTPIERKKCNKGTFQERDDQPISPTDRIDRAKKYLKHPRGLLLRNRPIPGLCAWIPMSWGAGHPFALHTPLPLTWLESKRTPLLSVFFFSALGGGVYPSYAQDIRLFFHPSPFLICARGCIGSWLFQQRKRAWTADRSVNKLFHTKDSLRRNLARLVVWIRGYR